MSWITKINTGFIITCGEGSTFNPLWLNAARQVEYNVSEFNYPNTPGTHVERRQPKGFKYSIQVIFQGEDHLDVAERFQAAADDPRPWIIEHPLYGRIVVQPVQLSYDNRELNTSTVTGDVIETISEIGPAVSVEPVDQIAESKNISDELGAAAFEQRTPNPYSMGVTSTSLYAAGRNAGGTPSQMEGYFNTFNNANAAILNATAEPLAAMRAVQRLIEAPALFEISVQNRMNILIGQFTALVNGLSTLSDQSGKLLFEVSSGSLITAMCQAAANPLAGNYQNMTSVLAVIDQLSANYDLWVSSLDSIQTDNGGDTDSFQAGFEFGTSVSGLVDFTVSELFAIALGARQERTLFLENDSNVILLTHRFYGTTDNDAAMDEFMSTNNIGRTELLEVRQGRTILYYV